MSYNPTFIWERNHERLKIHPDRRYLFYYRGCFCPPHAGHFDAAAKYLKYPNVRMIIHQMGGSRHGVSVTANRKIWNWYIDELLPKDRINLVQYNDDTRNYPKDHPWLKSSDVLIIIRGDEVKPDLDNYEQLDCIRWDSTIRKCRRFDVDVVFVYDLRDHDTMSASTFITNLIKYKEGRYPISHLYKYLPKDLSIETKRKIIHLLIQYHLK